MKPITIDSIVKSHSRDLNAIENALAEYAGSIQNAIEYMRVAQEDLLRLNAVYGGLLAAREQMIAG